MRFGCFRGAYAGVALSGRSKGSPAGPARSQRLAPSVSSSRSVTAGRVTSHSTQRRRGHSHLSSFQPWGRIIRTRGRPSTRCASLACLLLINISLASLLVPMPGEAQNLLSYHTTETLHKNQFDLERTANDLMSAMDSAGPSNDDQVRLELVSCASEQP